MDFKLNEVCRVCLENENDLQDIFQDNIAQKIMNLTSIKIEYTDEFPQYICKGCFNELEISINFITKCETSNTEVLNYLHNVSTVISNISVDSTNLKMSDIRKKSSTQFNINDYKLIPYSHSIEGKTELSNVYECVLCVNQSKCLKNYKEHICDLHNKSDCANPTLISTDNKPVSVNTNSQSKIVCKQNIIKDNQCTDTLHRMSKTTINELTKNKNVQCEICGKITQYPSELKRHMRIHTGEKPFQCNLCTKTFRCKAFLTKHLQIHSGEKMFVCCYCPKSFKLKSNLTQHLNTHTYEKKYTCHICNNNFKTAYILKNHIKIHTGERNYPCSLCDKSFVDKHTLQNHERIHEKYIAIKEGTYDKSKDIPKQLHQCDYCGKLIANRGDLKKHMRVHTKERPFKCQTCSKAFSISSALHSHILTHTGAKPYNCQHCGLAFRQSSNLRTHERLHTGFRPYICTICNKGFNRNRDLKCHVKKHDNENI